MLRHFYFLAILFLGTDSLKNGTVTWMPSEDMSDKIVDPDTFKDIEEEASRVLQEDWAVPTQLWATAMSRLDNLDISEKVRFYYFNRENQTNSSVELKPDQLDNILKDYIKKPFVVVIHGYWHSLQGKMSHDLRKKLLENDDVNVVTVDWHPISRDLLYFSVVEKSSLVGKYIASLIDSLIDHGVEPSNVHLIGHSLGAHVAGYAGAFTKKGKVGRISGLDPALPGFQPGRKDKRLDPSDAEFVDCIHTCGGTLGFMDPICHADFYPNGGRNIQPGCAILDATGVCSHLRAPKYYKESIDPLFKFQAAKCPNIPLKGPVECQWTEHYMGHHLDRRARGVFYVQTSKTPPYSRVE